MPWGPNRVPDLYVVPPSKGTPKHVTSYAPTSCTFSQNGAFRNVLIPAKCGSSPRENVGMFLSSSEEAPGRPISKFRLTSASCFVVGMLDSFNAAFHPLVWKCVEVGSGWWFRRDVLVAAEDSGAKVCGSTRVCAPCPAARL